LADPNIDELQRRAALAKSILDGVVDSSKHEDEKVGRILTSMSFLTVGATIAFSSFFSNRSGLVAYGFDLVSILFFAYLFLLVLGTIIMLESMSPRLYLRLGPKAVTKDPSSSSASLDSMYFFKSIAGRDQAEWLSYFKNTSNADLLVRQCEDALRQARFLSRKVTQKVEYIRLAKWVILFASIFLVAMVGAGVLLYLF
jgi:hypothetical protein